MRALLALHIHTCELFSPAFHESLELYVQQNNLNTNARASYNPFIIAQYQSIIMIVQHIYSPCYFNKPIHASYYFKKSIEVVMYAFLFCDPKTYTKHIVLPAFYAS